MQIKQTKKLESVLLGGCYEARRRSSSEVTTDHLFLAILKQEESHASHVLRKLLKNWEIDQIKTRLEREMGPAVAQDGRSQALRQTIAINGESMLRQIISDAGKGGGAPFGKKTARTGCFNLYYRKRSNQPSRSRRTAQEASISPAAGGQKLMLPGLCRPFCVSQTTGRGASVE